MSNIRLIIQRTDINSTAPFLIKCGSEFMSTLLQSVVGLAIPPKLVIIQEAEDGNSSQMIVITLDNAVTVNNCERLYVSVPLFDLSIIIFQYDENLDN